VQSPLTSCLGGTFNHTHNFFKHRNDLTSRKNRFQPLSTTILAAPVPSSNDSGEQRLLGITTGSDLNIDYSKRVLPPKWVDYFDEVSEKIKDIKCKMGELKKVLSRRVKPKFEDKENESLDREINSKIRELTIIFKDSEGTLKRIVQYESLDKTDEQIRKNIQIALASELQDLAQLLRKTEKEHFLKIKEINGDDEYLDNRNDNAKEDFLNDEGIMELDEEAHIIMKERDEEINKLVKSINDLAVIFKELSLLVIEQGTILDRIDFNIESALDSTKKGVVHLVGAEKASKSMRAKSCMLCLMAFIVLFTLLLIFKHT